MAQGTRKQQRPGSQKRQFLKTGLWFVAAVVGLDLITYLAAQADYLFFFNLLTTRTAAGLIHLSGLEASVSDNVIRLAHGVWIVDTECTAINLIIIFSSFVLVYPAPVKAKGAGIALGLPFIFAANVFRLFAMAWMDKLKPDYFIYLHDYVWQVVFLILVAFMWLIWIDKVVDRASPKPVSA
jgi:archaeosortase B (VPXXXP-CTERM-specific)